MSCDEIRGHLDAYLDGFLGTGQETLVRAHLETCASCAAELRDIEAFETAARAIPREEPPPDFTARVMQASARRQAERAAGTALVLTVRPNTTELALSEGTIQVETSGHPPKTLTAPSAVRTGADGRLHLVPPAAEDKPEPPAGPPAAAQPEPRPPAYAPPRSGEPAAGPADGDAPVEEPDTVEPPGDVESPRDILQP